MAFNIDVGSGVVGFLNYQQQEKQLEYQKQLNALQVQREDTAYRRAVEDARAAGLSPLSVSQGAASGSLNAGDAPQLDIGSQSVGAEWSDFYLSRKQKNEDSTTEANNAKAKAEAAKAQEETVAAMIDNQTRAEENKNRLSLQVADLQAARVNLEKSKMDIKLKNKELSKIDAEIASLNQQIENAKQTIEESKARQALLEAQQYGQVLSNTSEEIEQAAAAAVGQTPQEYKSMHTGIAAPLISSGMGAMRGLGRVGSAITSGVSSAGRWFSDKVHNSVSAYKAAMAKEKEEATKKKARSKPMYSRQRSR